MDFCDTVNQNLEYKELNSVHTKYLTNLGQKSNTYRFWSNETYFINSTVGLHYLKFNALFWQHVEWQCHPDILAGMI